MISVSKGKTPRKRATRLSAVKMLEAKYQRKADLKEQRMQEFEFQKQKYEDEASERKEKAVLRYAKRETVIM